MCLYNILNKEKIQYIKGGFNIKNYKQILMICGLIGVIIVGICICFYQNKDEDYSYLEVSNEKVIATNVIEEEKKEIIVHITGQVVKQGIVKLEEGSRIIDAIEAAGGATTEANLSKINLAYLLEDGMKLYVPSINDEEEEEYVSSNNTSEKTKNSKEILKVNINTATSEELQKLPGIGEAMANRIITYRKESGKFNKIEDLKEVSGIGEAKFNNIKSYIYIK